jgi:hypothetical protein
VARTSSFPDLTATGQSWPSGFMAVICASACSLAEAKGAQQIRSRWRALLLVIKAKLEAVDIGILTAEDAFMAETILPDRQTVAEYMRPHIESAYAAAAKVFRHRLEMEKRERRRLDA